MLDSQRFWFGLYALGIRRVDSSIQFRRQRDLLRHQRAAVSHLSLGQGQTRSSRGGFARRGARRGESVTETDEARGFQRAKRSSKAGKRASCNADQPEGWGRLGRLHARGERMVGRGQAAAPTARSLEHLRRTGARLHTRGQRKGREGRAADARRRQRVGELTARPALHMQRPL